MNISNISFLKLKPLSFFVQSLQAKIEQSKMTFLTLTVFDFKWNCQAIQIKQKIEQKWNATDVSNSILSPKGDAPMDLRHKGHIQLVFLVQKLIFKTVQLNIQ